MPSKLRNYGIRGIAKNWFESYLINPKQVVKVGNVLSEQKFIACGVPQESTLGPTLFLLCINNIKNSSKILNFFLFADSTSNLLINKKVEEIEKIYNEELRNVSEWLNANNLSLNAGKSHFILFRKCQTKIIYKPDIKVMGERIKEKEFANTWVCYLIKHFSGCTTLTMLILKSLRVKQSLLG